MSNLLLHCKLVFQLRCLPCRILELGLKVRRQFLMSKVSGAVLWNLQGCGRLLKQSSKNLQGDIDPACSGLANAAAEAAAGLAWIWRPRRIEAISPVTFVLRVCVEPRLQKTGALQMRERSALIAIVGGFEVVLDGRSQLSVRPWIFGQRLRGLREFVQVEVAGSVDAGVAVGQRDAERRLAFFDVFQHLREARTHSEAEGSLFFHVLSLARGQLLRGSEHLPPLRAGPPELGDVTVDRLRHPAHGVGVLLALPFQLPVLEPLIERSGVHDLLVPPAHQRVEVVGGVLLPELAQHLLLVPRLDAHHGLCLSQNSMVFRVSSSSKRSARESCLMARIVAGVGGGSSASGSSAAAIQGREQEQQRVRGRRRRWAAPWACSCCLEASLCHASSAQPAAQLAGLLLWPQQVPRPPQQSLQLLAAQAVLPLRRQQGPRPCCFFFSHFFQ